MVDCKKISCCPPTIYGYAPSFTATASYTALCPVGDTGDPVTVTKTATSLVSYQDAFDTAEAAAQSEAESALVCEGPVPDCCMYDAASLDVDYTEDDLPDDVTVDGVTKARSGTGFGNTTNGVIWESGVWAVYVATVRTEQGCLFGGVVDDLFADTYKIFGVYTVTRISQCFWQTENWGGDCEGTLGYDAYQLYFDENESKWTIYNVFNEDGIGMPCNSVTQTQTGFQNTPIGTYSCFGCGAGDYEVTA